MPTRESGVRRSREGVGHGGFLLRGELGERRVDGRVEGRGLVVGDLYGGGAIDKFFWT